MARVRIVPSRCRVVVSIPDMAPGLTARYAGNRKRQLLAKVRYNRLIDNFFGVTAYSLQNHLHTPGPEISQIETGEVYIAFRNTGQRFIVLVLARGGTDRIREAQVLQDLALCRKKFPELTPRPVAVQFARSDAGEVIAMFALVEINGEIGLTDEKHYRLVPAN